MPRPLPRQNVKKAAIQARYREKLRQRREPEADRVDTALASAIAAYADATYDGSGSDEDRRIVRMIVQSAISILRRDGYDAEAAVDVMRRRISRDVRPELVKLASDSGLLKRMSRQ